MPSYSSEMLAGVTTYNTQFLLGKVELALGSADKMNIIVHVFVI